MNKYILNMRLMLSLAVTSLMLAGCGEGDSASTLFTIPSYDYKPTTTTSPIVIPSTTTYTYKYLVDATYDIDSNNDNIADGTMSVKYTYQNGYYLEKRSNSSTINVYKNDTTGYYNVAYYNENNTSQSIDLELVFGKYIKALPSPLRVGDIVNDGSCKKHTLNTTKQEVELCYNQAIGVRAFHSTLDLGVYGKFYNVYQVDHVLSNDVLQGEGKVTETRSWSEYINDLGMVYQVSIGSDGKVIKYFRKY